MMWGKSVYDDGGASQGVNTQSLNLQRGEEYKLRKVVMIVLVQSAIAEFPAGEAGPYATGQSATQMRKWSLIEWRARIAAQEGGGKCPVNNWLPGLADKSRTAVP